MKKSGIINPAVCEAIASLGHTDSLVICDAGLPIPRGAMRIDLSVVRGVPTFEQVLAAVAAEIEVERAVMAEEATTMSPEVVELVRGLVPDAPLEFVPHQSFKELVRDARAVIRTGEFTPYANVILHSGVARLFGSAARV